MEHLHDRQASPANTESFTLSNLFGSEANSDEDGNDELVSARSLKSPTYGTSLGITIVRSCSSIFR